MHEVNIAQFFVNVIFVEKTVIFVEYMPAVCFDAIILIIFVRLTANIFHKIAVNNGILEYNCRRNTKRASRPKLPLFILFISKRRKSHYH